MLKKVKIGPVTYQISPTTQEQKNKGIAGICSNVWLHSIKLDETQKGVEAIDTLIHEMLHAMNDIKGMKLTHNQIYFLSDCFSTMLKDNPEVRKYINEQLT
jgi:hypothetical protein